MSGSYSGVNTFHTAVTVIEDGDDATGAVLSAPDKEVFDNTIYLKDHIDDAEDDIDALDSRLDTAEADIDALGTSLTITQGTLSATVSSLNDVSSDVNRRRVPGQFYGGFSGAFNIGTGTMITLTSVTETGDSSHRPTLATFDASGTPQANKCLLLPDGGVYDISFQIDATILSTTADFSRLRVQTSTNDSFTSPATLIDISAPLVTAAPKVNFAASTHVRTTVDLYVRFLLSTPAADDITIDFGRLTAVCVGETV